MTQPTTIARTAQPALPRAAEIDVTTMSLASLSLRAQAESRLFYRHEEYDARFAYELFRRALAEGDQGAWQAIYEHYYPLVEHWVRRTGAFAISGESSDYFVSAAFTRFWRAIPADRFRSFPNLASLLNYLRRCASCVVIDSARSHSYNDLLPEESVNWNSHELANADEEATDRVSRLEFWQMIDGLLNSEAERVVVRCSFLLGMKPGDIFGGRKDLFADVNEVYTLKRNILARLRRNSDLRGMY